MQKELRGKYIASRIFRKFGGGRMLRPEPSCPVEILLNIAKAVSHSDFPVLNLMLYSSELTLGCSPFTRIVADHVCVWGHLEEIFKYVSKSDFNPVSLSNAGALIRRRIQEYNKN